MDRALVVLIMLCSGEDTRPSAEGKAVRAFRSHWPAQDSTVTRPRYSGRIHRTILDVIVSLNAKRDDGRSHPRPVPRIVRRGARRGPGLVGWHGGPVRRVPGSCPPTSHDRRPVGSPIRAAAKATYHRRHRGPPRRRMPVVAGLGPRYSSNLEQYYRAVDPASRFWPPPRSGVREAPARGGGHPGGPGGRTW